MRGVDVTTEIAGLVRERRISSPGEEVKAGQAAGPAQRRFRHGAAARARGRRRARADGLERDQAQLEAEAISQAQVDARCGRSEEQARAGRAAGGDGRQEDDPRAVFRQARHHDGQSRAVSEPGRQDRDAADHRSDLRRLLPAAASRSPASSVGQTVDADRAMPIPGRRSPARSTSINPKVDTATRNVQIEATIAEPEAPAAARHVRHASASTAGDEEALPDAAADGDHLQPLRRDRVRRQGRRARRTPRATPRLVGAAGVRDHRARRAATRSRSSRACNEGQEVVTQRPAQAARTARRSSIDNSVQPANSPNPAPQEQ